MFLQFTTCFIEFDFINRNKMRVANEKLWCPTNVHAYVWWIHLSSGTNSPHCCWTWSEVALTRIPSRARDGMGTWPIPGYLLSWILFLMTLNSTWRIASNSIYMEPRGRAWFRERLTSSWGRHFRIRRWKLKNFKVVAEIGLKINTNTTEETPIISLRFVMG